MIYRRNFLVGAGALGSALALPAGRITAAAPEILKPISSRRRSLKPSDSSGSPRPGS